MRIVHAVRSDGFSGVERHIATLAAAQSRGGHDVSVIGGDVAMMGAALADVPVQSLPGRTVAEVMAQARRQRGLDIIHAHMTAGELAASLATRGPVVVTRHFARPRGTTTVGRIAAAMIERRVRAQIAISQFVARHIDGTSTVVYPGVESVAPTAVDRRPVVLVAQRLQPEKSTDVALRVFAAGAPTGWTLNVVGKGPELPALHALARELGIADRVSFLGFRDDVSELMRTSAVLLAPCEVEGLGLSVLEAMSHALAVVASRAGAHPETVGAANGARLFPPGAWQEGAAMLAQLIADQAGREAYGSELARIQRSRFTPATQAAATDEVYEAVLS